jgi:hypothetical protein
MPRIYSSTARREKLRNEFWPDEEPWTGIDEKGWFRAPRTLPLILELLATKDINPKQLDVTRVYLELWSRHIDSGIIEMVEHTWHAYAAGYSGSRAVRSWMERMKVLDETGFIKSKEAEGQRYKYVLLVHPTIAVQRLRDAGRIEDEWWDTYRARQIQTKESSYEERRASQLAVQQAAQPAVEVEVLTRT